ncbi:hypothetical protein IWQ62_002094 [Dispira parvispora]|uniref:Fungal-type protein kinase domain-containing protein n=1 Tax=Dispira parvispora TaxID=1520584 RepID=A0A9W8AR09_9FUNG|nr:hypothetical protein IWQ62_002094 [Dispira parvispora]
MTSQCEYSNSPFSTQCQQLTLDEADAQHAHAINLNMTSYMFRDEPDLVEKVTGVSSIGEYGSITRDIEALRHNTDSNPRHRELFEKAREWFDSATNIRSCKPESRMYPQVMAFIYLIALYVREKRQQSSLPLKRYILPHPKSNVKGDPTTRKRHDMILRWLDPDLLSVSVSDGDRDTGVLEECDAFLKSVRVNDSTSHLAPTVGSSQTGRGRYSNMNSKERQEDAIRERFWRCFGVIECNAQYNQNHEVQDYGQLGWYVSSALDAAFERNNMWGWVIAGTTVHFVFFTHGAAILSELIDMQYQEGRQLFTDNFIRLCVCSPYRAGFDLSKRWLPDEGKWEVDCFNSGDLEEAEPVRAYVDPIPFKIHGGLFGRRTRCHKAWLAQGTVVAGDREDSRVNLDTDVFVLKESWTELDAYPDERVGMNTESLPNEVRILHKIARYWGESESQSIAYGLPKLKAGGSVRIADDSSTDSGQFGTVARYCGDLDIVNKSYNVQPVGPTTAESGTGNAVPQFRLVNRVHQRLLMSPMGESLTELHSWARKPGNKTHDLDQQEKRKFVVNAQIFFARLFWIIYYLYKDLGVYHRDLSEGNVLVHMVNNRPYPLLIDFDRARLRSDPLNDNMHSRTGTVPIMSILNLAGRSNKLSIVDELESFLYLCVWKCTIGFSPSDITRSKKSANTSQVSVSQLSSNSVSERVSRQHATSHKPTSTAQRSKHLMVETEQPSVRLWAKGYPGTACLNAKRKDTASNTSFIVVLNELQLEFTRLKGMFLKLREVLFDWDGQQETYFEETVSRGNKRPRINTTGGNDPRTADQQLEDAMLEIYDDEEEVIMSNPSTDNEKYFKRLISRDRKAGIILEKFAGIIEDYIPIPFK